MIIFYAIPGNVLLLLAAVMFVGSIVFAIWYSIMQAKEESETIPVKVLSSGKRVAVLLTVIAIFASIFAVIYGFTNHNGIVGTFGFLAWMVASLIVAYTCSPLRLFYSNNQQGCAYILFAPLLAIISTVSLILIMLISWIFGLAAVLRGLSKKVYALIAVCIVVLIAAGVCLNLYQRNESAKEQEHKFLLVEEAMEQVLHDVEVGQVKKLTFDEETKLAMEEYGIKSFFAETEVREAIAKKFSQFYSTRDLDGLLEFLCFLNANYSNLVSEGNVYDICFSSSYLDELKNSVKTHGVFKEINGFNEIYTYNNSEFWFTPFGCYIAFEYMLNDEAESGTVILGDIGYREDQHKTYDESSPGYFLIDETVEFVEDRIESSEDLANKYYPAATCPKCGTSFRANTMRAQMIANHGYCGMGLCSKD